MKLRTLRVWSLGLLGGLIACQKPSPPVDGATTLRKASDVFWALSQAGYLISKEKPQASKHGCQPFEYLVRKEAPAGNTEGSATFRISVFECGDVDQASELVENSKSQHVDGLLRNHNEGALFQRGPLEIIVRIQSGPRSTTAELVKFLQGL